MFPSKASFRVHKVRVFFQLLAKLLLLFFFNFYFYFILLYNTVLVLPYIDMNPPRVYMSSQTWTPLPPHLQTSISFRIQNPQILHTCSSSILTWREAGSVFLTSPPSPHPPAFWYRAEAGRKSRKILIPCPWCWQTPLPFYNSADCLMGFIHLSLLSSLWQSISKDLTSPNTYLNFLLLVSCRKWSHRHQQDSSGLKPYSFLSTQGLYQLCTQLLQLAFQLHLFSALQDQAFGWSSGSKYSSKWLTRAP